jgi:hypothetical protein
MARARLPIGISVAALAAATAAAQTTSDSSGNSATRECAPGNSCTVDNMRGGNERNRAFVRQRNGQGNVASITQNGDDNSSTVEQSGNNNDAEHSQSGDRHTSLTRQTGDNHESVIFQGTRENSATVTQAGAGNISEVTQGTFFEDTRFTGEDNIASVSQSGSNLISFIDQSSGSSEGPPADDNSATLAQSGLGSFSEISQFSRGNIGVTRMFEGGVNDATGNRENVSETFQTNSFFRQDANGRFVTGQGAPDRNNNPRSNNLADVAVRGQQNSSGVLQNGVQNTAIVSMLGGGSGNSGNAPSDPMGAGRTVPAGRAEGNSSIVIQIGQGLFYEISSGGAGSSTTPNGQGNRSTVFQGSNANLGANHRATVYQRGRFDNLDINQQNNSAASAQTAANPGGTQSGSIADVSQLSLNSTTSITQRGTNTAIVTQGVNRNNASGGAIDIGGNNVITIDQTDAGDASTASGGSTRQSNFVEVAQYSRDNSTTVAQNAVNARATVFQPIGSRGNGANIQQGTGAGTAAAGGQGINAINLTADMTQRGSSLSATIGQGGTNLTATVNQLSSGAVASTMNVANLSQIGSNNVAAITQTGSNHSATVDQRGAGGADASASGGRDLRNRVGIEQTGDRHRATARQAAGVGPSASSAPASGDPSFPGARAAGTQSAEVQIIQRGARTGTDTSSAGNSATIEQQGQGQFARIFQDGRNNNAGILQGPNATNATAIIEQTGNNNSFFITQNQPGQYMRVVQTGSNNLSTTQVSGPGGGGSGSGSAQPPL